MGRFFQLCRYSCPRNIEDSASRHKRMSAASRHQTPITTEQQQAKRAFAVKPGPVRRVVAGGYGPIVRSGVYSRDLLDDFHICAGISSCRSLRFLADPTRGGLAIRARCVLARGVMLGDVFWHGNCFG